MRNIINNTDLEEFLINLIKECKEILDKKREISTSYKSDGTPVSNFDKEIDDFIFKKLNRYDSAIKIISEEKKFTNTDFLESIYWIIDPIDGTKSFIKGGEEFTVNIALILKGRPELGVIYHPPSNRIWFGKEKKFSIYKNFNEEFYKPYNKRWVKPKIICSRSLDCLTKSYIENIEREKLIRLSSSLKFCYLSESLANFYPRLTNINKWDIAAGHAILNASGGELTDSNGKEINYNTPSANIENFIASDIKNWKKYIKKLKH